jgi:predicted porin
MFRPFKTLRVVTALLAVPSAAHADDLPLSVRFYGFLNAEVEWVRAQGGATPYSPRMRVSDGNSRVGVFGAWDVTTKTQVQAQLEALLNNFEQGGINDLGHFGTLASRNSFVGISDKRFGAMLVGYYDNAYRSLVGTGGGFGGNVGLTELGLDLWNNTTAAVSGSFTNLFGRGEARLPNSIHYRSPNLFGVQVAISYGFDEAQAEGGRRDHLSAAALYKFDRFGIGLAYDRQANTGVDSDALLRGEGMRIVPVNDVSTNFYKAIVSYTATTGTYVALGYEWSVYGFANFTQPETGTVYSPVTYGTMSQGGAMASVAQPFGNLTLMGSVGKLGSLSNSIVGSGNDYQATQFSVGAKYALGRPFMVYAYFTRVENKPLQNINLGVPIYSNNLGTSQAFLAPGNNPMAGGIGAIARFGGNKS